MSEIKQEGGRIFVGNATDIGDFEIAKKCADALNKHYHGYAWAVNASSETGMVQVRNLSLSGEWGFNLHLSNVINDVDMKRVVAAGGEILERYNARRGTINHDQVDSLPTDWLGLFKVDAVQAVGV